MKNTQSIRIRVILSHNLYGGMNNRREKKKNLRVKENKIIQWHPKAIQLKKKLNMKNQALTQITIHGYKIMKREELGSHNGKRKLSRKKEKGLRLSEWEWMSEWGLWRIIYLF